MAHQRRAVDRRTFLKQAAGTTAALSFPTIIPAQVLGRSGIAPSNKIVMGAIGVGSMGQGDLNGFLHKDEVQVVAVCDVDAANITQARNMVDERYGTTHCQGYTDYRELLGRGDLDAVMHALPDHWHGIVAVDCARAGLDIHGQKPLARTVTEGRAICDAVQRYQRVWQTGSWQRSVGHFHRACELVRNGRIGTVDYVEVGLPNGSSSGVFPQRPVPRGLDYDLWLGPAPWREYTGFDGQGNVHWNWRWLMDYSGGQLTDWAGHHIDIAHWALDLDHTGPVEIEGVGQYPEEGTYDVPMAYKLTCIYESGLKMIVANAAQQPRGMGTCWYGDAGWIHVNRAGLSASDDRLLTEEIGPNETRLYRSGDHLQNFLDCVKTRRQTVTPAETAHRSISVALLGEIAMITGRTLKWNPQSERFVGDDQANALLSRPYRRPWHM